MSTNTTATRRPARNLAIGTGSNAIPEDKKAAAFLNVSLPGKSGKMRRIGAIPLRNSTVAEQQLLAWVRANPEKAIEFMIQHMVIEFNEAESTDAGFDLPSFE